MKTMDLIREYRLREYAPDVFRGPVGLNPDAIEDRLRNAGSEFIEVFNWRDALSRRVWVALQAQSILTYVDGDLTLETFSDTDTMLEAIESRKAAYAA
ncbi:hypothetical protein [Thioalkalivibrio sp. ALgr3]|uniref:hypothetical protein n=1 Tax=Thioalkalivibrio sp. ALgr3 TaxID=1239292 RepID=UPI00037B45F8|nr:hypothetical protein [Thioalkalivibrio sp. ALgr3]